MFYTDSVYDPNPLMFKPGFSLFSHCLLVGLWGHLPLRFYVFYFFWHQVAVLLSMIVSILTTGGIS
jgi:hypothetical protein